MDPNEAGNQVGSALHRVGGTEKSRQEDEARLTDTREELKNTNALIGQPFAEERELANMIVERNRLLQELSQAPAAHPVPAEDRQIAISEAAAIEPVSYTHLDVYKRQVSGSKRRVAARRKRSRRPAQCVLSLIHI